jgi:hypothetical protein
MNAELRRHVTSLTLALRAHDDVAAMIAAARLRRVAGDNAVARLLLDAAPGRVDGDPRSRLERWGGFAGGDRPQGPDLFELDAVELDLGLARFAGLYVASSVFWAGSLVGAVFDGARLELCELGRSNLERTSWRGARLIECSLAGSALVDATLDDACFLDCDLRGADLGVARRGALASADRTAFVRCDLRETNWDLRCLEGVELIDCKLDGSHGRGWRQF